MSAQVESFEGAYTNAKERQTSLASCIVNLFQSSLTPNASTPLADFTAAVATYDGYAAKTWTAWANPILAPGQGYAIVSPYSQFDTGATDPVTPNLIGGYYVTDAAGKLRQFVTFTSPAPMQLAHQGIPAQLTIIFPAGTIAQS